MIHNYRRMYEDACLEIEYILNQRNSLERELIFLRRDYANLKHQLDGQKLVTELIAKQRATLDTELQQERVLSERWYAMAERVQARQQVAEQQRDELKASLEAIPFYIRTFFGA